MTTFALDSSALVAWVIREPKWRAIETLLGQSTADPVLPAPALTEVIETARRRGNSSSPEAIAAAVAAKGMRTEPLGEADLVRAAKLLEASKAHPVGPHPKTGKVSTLSLGDALILAVVERLGIQVVTLDSYWVDFSTAGHTTAVVLCL